MKRFKLVLFLVFVGLFSFMFLGSVDAAYSEGTFGNEECITDTAFLSTAKTDYSFDSTTGKFVISGKTVQEYRETTTTQDVKIAFYEVSADGATLYAYVPSYSSAVSSDFTKELLVSLGISTEYTCDNVIKVSKTSVEGEGQTVPGTTTNCSEGYIYDETSKTCIEEGKQDIEKIESPNTASPASIAAVTVGLILVGVAVYLYLNKSNKSKINK